MSTLTMTCSAIVNGYADGLTMYDNPMIGHAEDLSNKCNEILDLIEENAVLERRVSSLQAAVTELNFENDELTAWALGMRKKLKALP